MNHERPAQRLTSNWRAERFQDLYRNLYDDVYKFAFRRIGLVDCEARAADVAHETFLTVWRRLEQVPADDLQARAWIFTVARNHLLHDQRSAARRNTLTVRVTDAALRDGAGEVSPDDIAIMQTDFSAAWKSLSAADQEAIAMAAFEDLPAAQAAQVLGIPTTTYNFRLYKARNSLRKALDKAPAPTQVLMQKSQCADAAKTAITGIAGRQRAPTRNVNVNQQPLLL